MKEEPPWQSVTEPAVPVVPHAHRTRVGRVSPRSRRRCLRQSSPATGSAACWPSSTHLPGPGVDKSVVMEWHARLFDCLVEPGFRSWVFPFSKRVHDHHFPITAIEALLYSHTIIAQHPLPSSENADPEPCHHNMG